MELENIILREVSQVQKAKSCIHMWNRPNTNTAVLWEVTYKKGRIKERS
jgi:hypothetical protein